MKYHYKLKIYTDRGQYVRDANVHSDVCLDGILREGLFLKDEPSDVHIGYVWSQNR